MATPAIPTAEPGPVAIGTQTIRQIEAIGTNGKVSWIHIQGINQAVKTLNANIGKLGLHDGATGEFLVEVIADTYQDKTTNVPWLKSFNGQPATLPGASQNGNKQNGSYSKEAARIAAIGHICAVAPLNEIQDRLTQFNQAVKSC